MPNIINVHLNKRDDYVSKYNNNILSNDLYNYILEECKGFSLKEDIIIKITSKFETDNKEKGIIIDLIRESFGSEISEMGMRRKRNINVDLFVFLVGIVALALYLFVYNVKIISEVVLVASWVLIWEGVYDLVFKGIKNKIEMERKKKLTECKIIFE